MKRDSMSPPRSTLSLFVFQTTNTPGSWPRKHRVGWSAAEPEPGGQQGTPTSPELPRSDRSQPPSDSPSPRCPTPASSPPEHSLATADGAPAQYMSTHTSSNSGHCPWEASSLLRSSLRLLWLLRRQTGVCFWRARETSTGEGAPRGTAPLPDSSTFPGSLQTPG